MGSNVLFFGIIAVGFVFFIFFFARNIVRFYRFQNNIFDAVEHLARKKQREDELPDGPRDYQCDQCGAALGEEAEVSPNGDFKCNYCGNWSNIHS